MALNEITQKKNQKSKVHLLRNTLLGNEFKKLATLTVEALSPGTVGASGTSCKSRFNLPLLEEGFLQISALVLLLPFVLGSDPSSPSSLPYSPFPNSSFWSDNCLSCR
jgi:hypothetical protein